MQLPLHSTWRIPPLVAVVTKIDSSTIDFRRIVGVDIAIIDTLRINFCWGITQHAILIVEYSNSLREVLNIANLLVNPNTN